MEWEEVREVRELLPLDQIDNGSAASVGQAYVRVMR